MTDSGEGRTSLQRDDVKKKPNLIDRSIEFLERDTKGIQIATYGVTSIGLLVALYKIRPFAKFKRPSDVPTRFMKMRIPLQGKAMRIEPKNGALIMVDHKPLIKLPRLGTPEYLPVKIAGVDVTNHGVSWLQTIVCGKKITFVPIERKNEYLDCTLNLEDPNENLGSIGEELVRLGFATVRNIEATSNDQQLLTYKASLNAAQKCAKIERNGYWHYTISPTYLWKLRYFIHKRLTQALPAKISRQLSL